MSEFSAVAPGKLLLVGEYAVLEGAPALVTAVDRFVHVRVRRGRGDAGRITCTPLGVSGEWFRVAGGRLQCRKAVAGRLGVTAKLLPRIVEALGRPAESLDQLAIDIDSGELFEQAGSDSDRFKLGLGSSAAVAAASIAALEQLFSPDPGRREAPAGRLQRWLPVYRDILGGRASGADLAASLAGGLVEFRDPRDSPPTIAPRGWPEGLSWLPVWVGKPASTIDLVSAFDRWRTEGSASAARAVDELSSLASAACAALDRADGLLEALSDYGAALDALGREAGIEIVSAPHRALRRAAERIGVVYKSCGAGGGDIGVAWSDDPERLRAFEPEVARIGALPLHLSVARTGAAPEPIRDGP
jgi:phosphomevalonate kinase